MPALRSSSLKSPTLKLNSTRYVQLLVALVEAHMDSHALGRQARSELHAKRREEKELRSVEKEHVQQISLLEGEVANLNKSLERSRESYESMKRSYTATCEEADRLRALVADLRRVSVCRDFAGIPTRTDAACLPRSTAARRKRSKDIRSMCSTSSAITSACSKRSRSSKANSLRRDKHKTRSTTRSRRMCVSNR